MRRAFLVDDNKFWEHEDEQRPQEQRKQNAGDWKQISEKMQTTCRPFSRDFWRYGRRFADAVKP